MRILIATGGTGGHIFPALRVARLLRERGHDIVFAGVLGIAEDQIMSAGFELINIKAKGFDPKTLKGMLQFAWLMTLAIIRSIGIIHRVHPDKVIGFGGYGSFPIIFAGRILSFPTMIHEQNVYPGKANRLMGKLSRKIAVSFLESRKFFNESKIIHTGCPCHTEISHINKQEARIKFGLDPHKTTILLLGGSQGSQKLNQVFFDFIKANATSGTLQAIHMSGKNEYAKYHHLYASLKLPVSLCAFISNIDEAYSACDIVMARAGASSVTEIGLLGLPAIIVPYPFAGGHQKYNAKVLSDVGAAHVIDQDQLTLESLTAALKNIINRHESREALRERVRGVLLPDAAVRLADALEGL